MSYFEMKTQCGWMDGDLPILEKNEEFVRRINLVKEGPLIWFFSEERCSHDFVGYVMLQDEGDAIALGFAVTVVTVVALSAEVCTDKSTCGHEHEDKNQKSGTKIDKGDGIVAHKVVKTSEYRVFFTSGGCYDYPHKEK